MRSEWNLRQYLAYLSSWSASQAYLRRTRKDPVAAAETGRRETLGQPGQGRTV